MKESTKMFLEGETSEQKFYCITKENLITLREYLKMLKEKERKFKYYAKEEIDIVKRNLKWVKDIQFDGQQNQKTGGYIFTTLHLITTENEDYILEYNHETKKYEPMTKKIPKIYYLNPRIRRFAKRMEELYKVQPELESIEHWGRVTYDKCLFPRDSVSGNFKVFYAPQSEILVDNDHEVLIGIYERRTKYQDKPILTGEAKERALDLIQLEAKNLPDLKVPSTAAVYIFADSEEYKKKLTLENTSNQNNN